LGFNGTFSSNQLHHAFDKYVAVKKMKLTELIDWSLTALSAQ